MLCTLGSQVWFSLPDKLHKHLKTKTLKHLADCVGSPVCSWGVSCPWLSAYSALLDLWPTLSVCPSSSPVLVAKPRDSPKVLWLLPPTTHWSESVDSLSDSVSTASLWIYRGLPPELSQFSFLTLQFHYINWGGWLKLINCLKTI